MDWQKRHTIEQPLRPPDLNRLGYFSFPLKNLMFAIKPTNLDELRNRILAAASITPENLQNVVHNYHERLAHCQTVADRQFEHITN